MISAWWLLLLGPLSLMGAWLFVAVAVNWRYVLGYFMEKGERSN